MDPRDESESLAPANKNTSDTSEQKDHEESVLTPVIEQSESVPTNGPLIRNANTLVNNDNQRRAPNLSGTNPDCDKTASNKSGATHPQMCKHYNSKDFERNCLLANISHSSPEDDQQSCTRDRVCGNNYNAPSTSGLGIPSEQTDNNAFKENRKRPTSLRLNRQIDDEEDSSSDTGNDECSLGSEDGCVYTYRGGEHLADLPSSFFSLDMGLPLDKHLPAHPNYVPRPEAPQNVRDRSRESSPDMDFLEMDFDPGPSNEADSGDESEDELVGDLVVEAIEGDIVDEIPLAIAVPAPELNQPESFENKSPSCDGLHYESLKCNDEASNYNMPSTSTCFTFSGNANMKSEASGSSTSITSASSGEPCGAIITHVNIRGESLRVLRTTSLTVCNVSASIYTDHLGSAEFNDDGASNEEYPVYQVSNSEQLTEDQMNRQYSATYYYNSMMFRRLMAENNAAALQRNIFIFSDGEASGDGTEVVSAVPRTMVWSEQEACEHQASFVGSSDCGATAVANVLTALGCPVNVERINAAVGARPRANKAPLPRYLLSRAVAGCTAADIVFAIEEASDGLMTAQFFPTHPERMVSLSHWLADWIYLGAVPILTLNLQVGAEGRNPDMWYHQMVFGVCPRGIYLNNPPECVSETALWPRLISPSVVHVRSRDVLSRFKPNTDLTPLMAVPDRRFHTSNVLGQVVNLIREWRAPAWAEGIRTQYISIPAAHQAGITIAVLVGSDAHCVLMNAAQLPLLYDEQVNK